jgi:predicted RNase H-like HicB family nuclease
VTDRYQVVIRWNAADAIFVAEAPDLPGCIAHGATRAEALLEIEAAMTLWLDTAREFGRVIPIPRGGSLPQMEREG